MTGEIRSTLKETCPSTLLSTKSSTWTALEPCDDILTNSTFWGLRVATVFQNISVSNGIRDLISVFVITRHWTVI